MFPILTNQRWMILKVVAFLLLGFNEVTGPSVWVVILLCCLKKHWEFVADWACFLLKLGKIAWSVYYWIGGFWFFHGIYKGIVWIATHQHQQEFLPQQQHQQRPTDQKRAHQPVIKTWLNCIIFDHQNAARSSGPDGSRLVAHIDTGNQAHTAISKATFEMLYPGGKGATYKGIQTIQGVTGASKRCQVVQLQYRLDGVVGPSQKALHANVDAIIVDKVSDGFMSLFNQKEQYDILISTNDMQVFYNKFGYVIQPISRHDFLSGRA